MLENPLQVTILPKPLKRSYRKALALIQIGAFLEYFDLYLYVHMGIVLNSIFFPKTDPYTSSLLAAFTFSSSYLLRPIGALFFGYLGDIYGRKATIIITTTLMALCSFVIASLPPYSKIGLSASVIMVGCRMLQGFSAVGEFIGAMTYVTETTKVPRSYFYTALVAFFTNLGSTSALIVGSFFMFLDSEHGWRTAFYFGAAIAVVGSVARTKLHETPEFSLEKRKGLTDNKTLKDLLPKKWMQRNFLCFIGVECLRPLYFYLSFIYLAEVLKNTFHLTTSQIMRHNLVISLIECLACFIYGRLALKIYPMKILKVRGVLFLIFSLSLPFLLNHASTVTHIFMIQCGLLVLGEGVTPAHVIFLRTFPPIGRYTQAALAYSISRIITTLLISYGCVFIGAKYGNLGITGFLLFFIALYLTSVYSLPRERDTKF